MSFHSTRKAADSKYGVSAYRPQDMDKDMKITCRQNNLGMARGPARFAKAELLFDVVNFTQKDLELLALSSLPPVCIHWITDAKSIVNCFRLQKVLGFDLEFHNHDTYEGYIAVASVSNAEQSAVVDALYDCRKNCVEVIGNILEDQRVLKVFCGASNDIIRLQKDWNCKPVNFIDVQIMYSYWKKNHPEDCYTQSKAACKTLLQQKRKRHFDIDGDEVRKFFEEYNQPSLSYLLELSTNGKMKKDNYATYADFRKRPLHPELVTYAGYDAFYALRIFGYLGLKIGQDGFHQCLYQSLELLPISYSVVNYQCLKLFQEDEIGRSVQQWREYLAKNLDHDPELLISTKNVALLIDCLKNCQHLHQDSAELSKYLASYGIQDDPKKAAMLLVAYLDPNKTEIKKMENIVCRRCNTMGHTARFCYQVLTDVEIREAKREFRKRSEFKQFKDKQYQRRKDNYLRKRNPLSKVPWEKT